MKELLLYSLMINLLGIYVMYADKKRARQQQYRISENTLWMVALLGGAIGTTFGMQMFRHKTKHLSFKIGFPLLAILDVAGSIYVFTVLI